MKKSNYTKSIEKKFYIYYILDWVSLFLPTIIYVIVALFSGGVTVSGKVSIVASVMIAIILSVFNIIMKKKLTSIIWILLIGLSVAFNEYIVSLAIIMAITSALHDFIFGPMSEVYKTKLISSKTQDERAKFEQNEKAVSQNNTLSER